jgi:three-Cys-motif partner protein
MTDHRFGGPWTEEKLARLKMYLSAYMRIFTKNPRAAYFKAVYVDAFAGTGSRMGPGVAEEAEPLFDPGGDSDAEALRKGSPQIALETEPPFAQYIFVEQNPEHAQTLERLRDMFPALSPRVTVVSEDANLYLRRWCQDTDWKRTRAIVFLDPYGMQVEWATIAAMGSTRAIDLWVLFPLGVGVNRLLRKDRPPEGPWASRLTKIFGTEGWREAFYRESAQASLFGGSQEYVKDADFGSISRYWMARLKTVFSEVAPNPLPLRNSRNIPIYLLSFAAANPKGAKTAVRIAQDILAR